MRLNDEDVVNGLVRAVVQSVRVSRVEVVQVLVGIFFVFFFSSRRRHTRFDCDWSSDVCSSDLTTREVEVPAPLKEGVIVPSVLPFRAAADIDPSLADVTPFAVGGVQFTPLVEKEIGRASCRERV